MSLYNYFWSSKSSNMLLFLLKTSENVRWFIAQSVAINRSVHENVSLTASHRSQISFIPSATGISNLMLNFWLEMFTSGVTSQPTEKQQMRCSADVVNKQCFWRRPWRAFTSQVHLVRRRAVGLLAALVAGDCDVLERAPVLLVSFQSEFLWSEVQAKVREITLIKDPSLLLISSVTSVLSIFNIAKYKHIISCSV